MSTSEVPQAIHCPTCGTDRISAYYREPVRYRGRLYVNPDEPHDASFDFQQPGEIGEDGGDFDCFWCDECAREITMPEADELAFQLHESAGR
jgi:hypothetical protein